MIAGGYSIQGKSHVDMKRVCQDTHIIAKLKNDWMLAAVADGVGSSRLAEYGSAMAVEYLHEYLDSNLPTLASVQDALDTLQNGYTYTLDHIFEYIQSIGGSLDDYDTTLHSVLYNGETVVFGHAGDGGIIVKTMDGENHLITKAQKGEDLVCVCPLRSGEDVWEFGIFSEKVSAVMLATDGMLDVFAPFLLNIPKPGEVLQVQKTGEQKTYCSAVEFFLNPYCLYRNQMISNPEEILKQFLIAKEGVDMDDIYLDALRNGYTKTLGVEAAEELLPEIEKYCYLPWAIERVLDDKTVVWLMNDEKKLNYSTLETHREPDWTELNARYRNWLYPNQDV